MLNNGLTSLDLFCGAGGITEGFRQAGFTSLFGNDFNDHAMAAFARNHPDTMAVGGPIEDLNPFDIRSSLGLRKRELDCLVGGPPCQGFSINAPERFLEDPRNSLFRQYLRFIDEFEPKTLLFENVPGMLSLAGGAIVRQVIAELSSRGYAVSHRVLFSAHYGVPQERWRLIILGSRVGAAPRHPQPTHGIKGRANFTGGRTMTFRLSDSEIHSLLRPVTIADALDDLPQLESGEGADPAPYPGPPHSEYAAAMRLGSLEVRNHVAPRISKINLERLQHIQPGGSWRDIPRELLPAGMLRARTSDHTRRYGRLHPDGLSGTVMTKIDPHWGAAFHHSQHRTLTVREAARLQSFPDRYVFEGPKAAQYEQVGNAVPVLMAAAIAKSLEAAIEGKPLTHQILTEQLAFA